MVPARISLVTLGVAEVPRARTFYRSLGWEAAVEVGDEFCVLRTAGALLALYPINELRADMGEPPDEPADPATPAPRRTACAINVASRREVDDALVEAVAAGGAVLSAAAEAEWGGYSGYFADPDGHAWEVAYNPGWPLGEDGLPHID